MVFRPNRQESQRMSEIIQAEENKEPKVIIDTKIKDINNNEPKIDKDFFVNQKKTELIKEKEFYQGKIKHLNQEIKTTKDENTKENLKAERKQYIARSMEITADLVGLEGGVSKLEKEFTADFSSVILEEKPKQKIEKLKQKAENLADKSTERNSNSPEPETENNLNQFNEYDLEEYTSNNSESLSGTSKEKNEKITIRTNNKKSKEIGKIGGYLIFKGINGISTSFFKILKGGLNVLGNLFDDLVKKYPIPGAKYFRKK